MNNPEKIEFLTRWLPLAAGLVVSWVVGCRAGGETPDAVVSPFTTRFSLPGSTEGSGQQQVGLQVLSENDLVSIDFAERLQQKLATELELAHPDLRVAHLPSDGRSVYTRALPVPDSIGSAADFSREPHTVPPVPPMPPMTPSSDRVFQVRVIQYRPWQPMHLHLQLAVFDGNTRQQLHASTAAWSFRDDQICGGCDEKPGHRHRRKRGCKDSELQACQPSPIHNSPEKLLDLVAFEIAQWYGGVPISENP